MAFFNGNHSRQRETFQRRIPDNLHVVIAPGPDISTIGCRARSGDFFTSRLDDTDAWDGEDIEVIYAAPRYWLLPDHPSPPEQRIRRYLDVSRPQEVSPLHKVRFGQHNRLRRDPVVSHQRNELCELRNTSFGLRSSLRFGGADAIDLVLELAHNAVRRLCRVLETEIHCCAPTIARKTIPETSPNPTKDDYRSPDFTSQPVKGRTTPSRRSRPSACRWSRTVRAQPP